MGPTYVAKVLAVRYRTDRTGAIPRQRKEFVPAFVKRANRSGYFHVVPAYPSIDGPSALRMNVLGADIIASYPEAREAVEAIPDSTD